jgi:hypothetical protein
MPNQLVGQSTKAKQTYFVRLKVKSHQNILVGTRDVWTQFARAQSVHVQFVRARAQSRARARV